MPTVTIATTPPYEIIIAPGALAQVADGLASATGVFLVVDENVRATHGADVCRALADAGIDFAGSPGGCSGINALESHKVLKTVEALYRDMLSAGLDRSSMVIAVGGGITGDIAGFVAATYLRGVAVIQVPTTLLAMVDAAIGGKTGVNFPLPDTDQLGKNLIGAFQQPARVIADPRTLSTLPPRHLRCGLAECIKHAMIAGGDLPRFLEQKMDDVLALDMAALTELIERCARVKAEIVADDEHERGRRELLNLGHTFAHVIEPIAELDLHHGEAVAIGLCAAMSCAEQARLMSADDATRMRDLIHRAGLPLRLSAPVGIDHLMRAMMYDKKARAGRLRLILPHDIGDVRAHDDIDESLVRDTWRRIGAVDS